MRRYKGRLAVGGHGDEAGVDEDVVAVVVGGGGKDEDKGEKVREACAFEEDMVGG